jgi:3'-phosphoadenosine 5'-phosphosulfate sulfotransferase (PAPS reductase)/FAD synthetase
MSIKDDLDFPGEDVYVGTWGERWGLEVDIVRPDVSLAEVYAQGEIGEDIHSRKASLSRVGFYPLIDRYARRRGWPGVVLGLRSEESRYRAANRAMRGLEYFKNSGEAVCQPLGDWSARDVFAYLMARGIDPLPVYKCCANRSPEIIRKSWWAPGVAARHGDMVWLRLYWPSLYRQLLVMSPEASAFA